MADPRILIVGPGAVGCGLAAHLSSRGAHLALLDHRPERAAQISRDGIEAQYEGGTLRANVVCVADPRALEDWVDAVDLVIVLVKAYATAEAARNVAPLVGDSTAVLTIQNGLGNYEALAEQFPPQQVLAGTIVMGCNTLVVGRVHIAGIGDIVVGSPFGNDGLARRAADILDEYMPGVEMVQDILPPIWRKVTINAGVNTLTALTGLRNGQLLEDEGLRETLGAIVCETAQVAAAQGADAFGDADPVAAVEEVCRVTAQNRTSMLQDVTEKRRTEIDQICGEVARRAEASGVPAPLNGAMAAIIGAIERQYLTAG